MKFFKNLFKPTARIQKLIDELEQSSKKTRQFIQNFDPMVDPYCSIRQAVCLSCGLLYWEKDTKHRYIKANAAHCITFFGVPATDVGDILGKTDIELLGAYRKTGHHSYGDLCYSTDEYIRTHMGKHRFFEFGAKDQHPLILDVTKEAMVDDTGTFMGTRGFALNMSSREKDALILLFQFLKDKTAWRLDPGDDPKVAAYYVKDLSRSFEAIR